jgi:hypothetical protein
MFLFFFIDKNPNSFRTFIILYIESKMLIQLKMDGVYPLAIVRSHIIYGRITLFYTRLLSNNKCFLVSKNNYYEIKIFFLFCLFSNRCLRLVYSWIQCQPLVVSLLHFHLFQNFTVHIKTYFISMFCTFNFIDFHVHLFFLKRDIENKGKVCHIFFQFHFCLSNYKILFDNNNN